MNSKRLQDIRSAYKSQLYFYKLPEHIETKIKNKIPFTINPKSKYLGIYLTKYVWDLYAKNYKMVIFF